MCRRTLFPGTGITIAGMLQMLPGGKMKEISGVCRRRQLRRWRRWALGSDVQVIVEVGIDAATYGSEQYQSRIRAPSVCPNCGIGPSLEAHGYYWRWVTETLGGKGAPNCGQTFFCRCCAVTVSCLPNFAQPYRIVCNSTIEAFFEGGRGTDRPDVRRWGQLLGRYQQA
jgi:hypothetical protein